MGSKPGVAVDPVDDLRVSRVARPCRSSACLGRGVRVGDVRAADKPFRQSGTGAEPPQAVEMKEDEMPATIEIAQEARERVRPEVAREAVFDVRQLTVRYAGTIAVNQVSLE